MCPPYTSCQPPLRLDVATIALGAEICLVLRGEVDHSNQADLHDALTATRLEGAEVVRLLLGELSFCDVAAFGELVAFATTVKAKSLDFTVHDANPTVRKMAEIFGVSSELGFM